MRYFVGIELEEKILEQALELQEELKEDFREINFLDQEQLCLTVKFLGNPHKRAMGKIKRTLSSAASQVAPFEFTTTEIGCFPEDGPARVIWLGVKDNSGMLERFQEDCEREFEKMGIAREEKKFIPHIVIGRLHQSKDKDKLRRKVEELSVKPLSQAAKESGLVQSKLTKNGPQYKVLNRAKFTATVL